MPIYDHDDTDWIRIGRYDRARRRSTWARLEFIEGPPPAWGFLDDEVTAVELCSGREGDDAFCRVERGDSGFPALLDVIGYSIGNIDGSDDEQVQSGEGGPMRESEVRRLLTDLVASADDCTGRLDRARVMRLRSDARTILEQRTGHAVAQPPDCAECRSMMNLDCPHRPPDATPPTECACNRIECEACRNRHIVSRKNVDPKTMVPRTTQAVVEPWLEEKYAINAAIAAQRTTNPRIEVSSHGDHGWLWVTRNGDLLADVCGQEIADLLVSALRPATRGPEPKGDALERAFWRFDSLHKAHYRHVDPNLPGPLSEREAFKRAAGEVVRGACLDKPVAQPCPSNRHFFNGDVCWQCLSNFGDPKDFPPIDRTREVLCVDSTGDRHGSVAVERSEPCPRCSTEHCRAYHENGATCHRMDKPVSKPVDDPQLAPYEQQSEEWQAGYDEAEQVYHRRQADFRRQLREAKGARSDYPRIESLERALARAPCRWPAGVPQECSEGDPCETHAPLTPWARSETARRDSGQGHE